jgi:hypothetical protein
MEFFRSKEVDNQDVVGQWANSKKNEIGNNKAFQVLQSIVPKLDSTPTTGGRFTIASGILGPQAATYVTAWYDQKKIRDQISSLQDQKATMHAKNQDVSSLTKQINDLTTKSNGFTSTLKSSEPAFMKAINSEAAKTMDPKYNSSQIFSKNSYYALNTTTVPAAISDQWFSDLYGKPTTLTGADGTSINGYTGNSSLLQFRSQNGDNRPNSFINENANRLQNGTIKNPGYTPSVVKQTLTNFYKELESGYYDGQGVTTNAGEVLHDGPALSNSSIYYVPASALKDRSSIEHKQDGTTNEYRILKSLFGFKTIITKDAYTGKDGVVHKGRTEEYIPIPTYLKTKDDNMSTETTLTNAGLMKNSGQGKAYYQNKTNNTQSESNTESSNTTTLQ